MSERRRTLRTVDVAPLLSKIRQNLPGPARTPTPEVLRAREARKRRRAARIAVGLAVVAATAVGLWVW
jgi:hypothetical protein